MSTLLICISSGCCMCPASYLKLLQCQLRPFWTSSLSPYQSLYPPLYCYYSSRSPPTIRQHFDWTSANQGCTTKTYRTIIYAPQNVNMWSMYPSTISSSACPSPAERWSSRPPSHGMRYWSLACNSLTVRLTYEINALKKVKVPLSSTSYCTYQPGDGSE